MVGWKKPSGVKVRFLFYIQRDWHWQYKAQSINVSCVKFVENASSVIKVLGVIRMTFFFFFLSILISQVCSIRLARGSLIIPRRCFFFRVKIE